MSTLAQSDVDDLFEISLPSSPYPGLRPFDKSEWVIFFGRERMIDDVVSQLLDRRFVTIHGDSGCGKSSLVRAGVLPRLEQEHHRDASVWKTTLMQPADAPMRNLATAFAQFEAPDADEKLISEYHRLLNLGEDAAPKLASRLARADNEYFCLLVDQFEELFAFQRRSHGLMLLFRRNTGTADLDPDNPAPWHLSLGDYEKNGNVAKQLPARADDEKTGNVADLLSAHADDVSARIAQTHGNGAQVLESVFRALTDIDADGHAVRNPQRLSRLAAIAGTDTATLNAILMPLRADGVSFIRPYGENELGADDFIDISHEALIRCWKQVSAANQGGWLHREFEDGLIWKSLLVQAESFERDKDEVLSPATTMERAAWLKSRSPVWSQRYGGKWQLVGDLLIASQANMRRQKITKVLLGLTIIAVLFTTSGFLLYRSQSEENSQLAQQQTRLADDLRREKALVESQRDAVTAALEKFRRAEAARKAAERDADQLRSKLLAERSLEASAAGETSKALALALPALAGRDGFPYVADAENAAYEALFSHHVAIVLDGQEGRITNAAFSPDGTRVVTASDGGSVRILDAKTAQSIVSFTAHKTKVFDAQFSADGTRVVTASADATARVWDATTASRLCPSAPAKTHADAMVFMSARSASARKS